jgi:hypothetical protein
MLIDWEGERHLKINSLLSFLSYFIAEEQKSNPYMSILEHLAIAILVIAVSYFLREWIMNFFKV